MQNVRLIIKCSFVLEKFFIFKKYIVKFFLRFRTSLDVL